MSKLSELLVTRETFESDKYQDLLAASKYERMVWDDFRDGGLVETTPMTLESNGYAFTAGQVLQSTNLTDAGVTANITECFLIVVYEDSGTPTIELSADGGSNWEDAESANIHTFANVGNDLRVRFTAGGTGKIRLWVLLYIPHTTSLIETLTESGGNGIETYATLPTFQSSFQGYVIYVSGEDAYYAGLADKWARIAPPSIMENLIGNSGFGVWSRADVLANAGSNLVSNGTFDTNITGWTDESDSGGQIFWNSNSGEGNTGCLDLAYQSGDAIATQDVGLEKGKLYRLTLWGSSISTTVLFIKIGDTTLNPGGKTFSSGGEVLEYLFVPENTGDTLSLIATAFLGNIYLDNVEVCEVGPGVESVASYEGPDLWSKSLLAQAHRQYIADDELPKCTYCTLITPDLTDGARLGFPHGGTLDIQRSWLDKVRGRTLTFGAWVWSDTSTTAQLRAAWSVGGMDSWSYENSEYHPGGSEWKWLEVTFTYPSTDLYRAQVQLNVGAGTAVVKIACPMLVFGSYIGEGNWIKKPHDAMSAMAIAITDMIGTFSTETKEIDIQVSSEGKLPNNIQSLGIRLVIQEATADAASSYVILRDIDNSAIGEIAVNAAGLAANAGVRGGGILNLSRQSFLYDLRAGGASTLSVTNVRFTSVVLK